MKNYTKIKIDLEIRFFRRCSKESDFIITINNKPFRTKTTDYSFNGLGIIIEDSPPLKPGDIIDLDIDELNIHQKGRVVWTKELYFALRVGILKIGLLTGSFRNYRLSDIIIGLQRTLKTGILTIHQGSINKKVFIKNGNIIFATSNQDKERLGDILLRNRKITKEQYIQAAERKQTTGERYAMILVDLGFLKPSELVSAVELQAKRILSSLFTLREAEFEFKEGSLSSKDAVTLKLSAANLIYREVKKTADVDLIKDYFLDSILDFSPNPLDLFQDIRLNRIDRMIISLVNGKTSLREIIKLSSRNELYTLKCIYALLEARILQIKKEGEAPSEITYEDLFKKAKETPHKLLEKIEAMYSKYENLGYYGILGLKEGAIYDDIKIAYYKAAKEFHPDLHFNLPKDMKKKLLEIFIYTTNAYLTLIDPEKRKEYNNCLQTLWSKNARVSKDTDDFPLFEKDVLKNEFKTCLHIRQPRLEQNSEIAHSKFMEGKAKFKKEKFEEAAHLFAMAISFDRAVPEYHYFYGYALQMLGKLREAVMALNTALHMKPFSATIVAELGYVYLKLGFILRAKGYFNKALKLDASNTRAQEGIKILRKA